MARACSRGFGWLIAIGTVQLWSASNALAQVTIAAQDFNALSSSATTTTDSVANGSPLTNAGSRNNGGPGIDFDSFWIKTHTNNTGPIDLPDTSDFIGVNAATVTGLPAQSPSGATVGAAGDHNYEFNDSDGRIDVEFEPVDVSGYDGRELSLYYWIGTADTFETGDRFTVTLSDGTNNYVAADVQGTALNANRGVWIAISVDLDVLIENQGFGELLTLIVSGDTNGGSENIVFDSVAFLGESDAGPTVLSIPQIQGPGTVSPHVSEQVQTSGIVTGDFQLASQLGGFFMGAETGDGNVLTSDGIFVAALNTLTDVTIGDAVTVVGTVAEPGNLTTLVAQSVTIESGSLGVAPEFVEMPEATNGDLEHYEGMLVAMDDMTVAQTFFLGRYGQLTLSSANDNGVPGKLYQPTQLYDAGSVSALALANENQRRLLVLDDGQDVLPLGDNPNPVPYIGAPPPVAIRVGDRVTDILGVIDQGLINSGSAIDYRLHPVEGPTFVTQNPRTAAPTFNGLSVVSLNVLNYFTTLGSRGAQTAAELVRQRDKLVATITGLDADLYGMTEIQNNTAAIQDLVNALNAATSPGKYAFINTGVIGTDEIKVAFIYTPASITPVGAYAVLNDTVDPRAITTRNRPALAQTFASGGEKFTAIINHWKSKGSACTTATAGTNEIVDPDLNDGQGNCNLTRVSMAEAMIDWIESDPTSEEDPDFLIIGDLNSYANEDPPQVLKDHGYIDLVNLRIGLSGSSYVFDGQSGYLDHALASPSLAAKVSFAAEWHSNADEPKVLDYDTQFNPPGYYAPNAYRASDHDPLLIGINGIQPATAVPAMGRDLRGVFAVLMLAVGALLLSRRTKEWPAAK